MRYFNNLFLFQTNENIESISRIAKSRVLFDVIIDISFIATIFFIIVHINYGHLAVLTVIIQLIFWFMCTYDYYDIIPELIH